jgi:hypothetical protein
MPVGVGEKKALAVISISAFNSVSMFVLTPTEVRSTRIDPFIYSFSP